MTTNPKEKLVIQILVTFPTTTTPPSQELHKLTREATPLQKLWPSPNTSKVDEVTSFSDVNLDEVIVLPKFELAKITIEQMIILQNALARKKHQQLLRREHRKK